MKHLFRAVSLALGIAFITPFSAVEAGTAPFTYAHWNIGHYSYGTSNASKVAAAQGEAEAAKYSAFFDTLAADWIGISEYSENFTTDGSMKATTSIFRRYPVRKVGPSRNYQWNSHFGSSRFEVLETVTQSYTNHTQDVYYYAQRVKIDGETEAWFVQTHMDWSSVTVRRSQFEELLADFTNRERVVISGDFNCAANGKTEWDNYMRFTAAGFTLALTDESKQTYPQKTPDRVIDNIMVKGFTVSDVQTYPDCALSDHIAITCRLALPTLPVKDVLGF